MGTASSIPHRHPCFHHHNPTSNDASLPPRAFPSLTATRGCSIVGAHVIRLHTRARGTSPPRPAVSMSIILFGQGPVRDSCPRLASEKLYNGWLGLPYPRLRHTPGLFLHRGTNANCPPTQKKLQVPRRGSGWFKRRYCPGGAE
ncbi:unnamed protein product [Ectocarpus sp. 12 AP-2014]